MVIFLSGCDHNDRLSPFSHEEGNSIYYWRTEFKLNSEEREFLRRHQVERKYIRFFDVKADDYYLTTWYPEIYPNATIKFTDKIPESVKHVIPTVYITTDALAAMKRDVADASQKIVRRVLNMVSYNEIPNVGELQLDCDWTESNDSIYFALCDAVRQSLKEMADTTFVLSSTIRLHQLKKPVPPVDYGVLMCYNTGSFRNPECRNSILSYEDVAPYFRHNIDYPLHIDVALPIYEWTLIYQGDNFKGILRSDSIPEGYTSRHEKSELSDILKVKDLLSRKLLNHQDGTSIILYHLDSENLKNYSDESISKIYTCDAD